MANDIFVANKAPHLILPLPLFTLPHDPMTPPYPYP